MLKLSIFCLIFSFLALAEDDPNIGKLYPKVDAQNYSGKYFSGEYLVYDCQDKHWVCTDKEAVENCDKAVENSLKTVSIKVPCFIAKKFTSLSECAHYNRKLVDNLGPTRNCYHPKFKERIILFE